MPKELFNYASMFTTIERIQILPARHINSDCLQLYFRLDAQVFSFAIKNK